MQLYAYGYNDAVPRGWGSAAPDTGYPQFAVAPGYQLGFSLQDFSACGDFENFPCIKKLFAKLPTLQCPDFPPTAQCNEEAEIGVFQALCYIVNTFPTSLGVT